MSYFSVSFVLYNISNISIFLFRIPVANHEVRMVAIDEEGKEEDEKIVHIKDEEITPPTALPNILAKFVPLVGDRTRNLSRGKQAP